MSAIPNEKNRLNISEEYSVVMSQLFKGLTANAADPDTDGDVEAEAKGEAEAEDQQVLIATLDLQGGMLSIFLKHIFNCISNDSR